MPHQHLKALALLAVVTQCFQPPQKNHQSVVLLHAKGRGRAAKYHERRDAEQKYATRLLGLLTHERKEEERERIAADERQWLVDEVAGKDCNVVELQGTTGSSPAIDRKNGFEQAINGHDNIKLIRSQTGDFTRTKGKEVMESFLQAESGNEICALVDLPHSDLTVRAHRVGVHIGHFVDVRVKVRCPGLLTSVDAVEKAFEAFAPLRHLHGALMLSLPPQQHPSLSRCSASPGAALSSHGPHPQTLGGHGRQARGHGPAHLRCLC